MIPCFRRSGYCVAVTREGELKVCRGSVCVIDSSLDWECSWVGGGGGGGGGGVVSSIAVGTNGRAPCTLPLTRCGTSSCC